jgi:hypothetical protein
MWSTVPTFNLRSIQDDLTHCAEQNVICRGDQRPVLSHGHRDMPKQPP